MKIHTSRSELAALAVSLLLLLTVAVGITACGDDDLFFPGELLPTQTADPTDTPTDEEEEDDDEDES